MHTAIKSRSPRSNTGSFQAAVCHVGKRHAEASQHTFPVAKSPHWVSRSRATVRHPGARPRGPHRRTGTPSSFASRAHSYSVPKLQCGKKQTVNFFSLKLFSDLKHIGIIIEKPLLIDVRDIYKINAQFSQPRSAVSPRYLTASGALKILASGRRVTQFNMIHKNAPFLRFTTFSIKYLVSFFIEM